MLENKRSRVYCFCAVRSYHRSSRSAPKTRSREARTMTEMGLFCTNRSNTSPSMAASLMTKLKKAYRTQDRHTLTPLPLVPDVYITGGYCWSTYFKVLGVLYLA